MIVEGAAQAHVEFQILAAVVWFDYCCKNVELNISLSDTFNDQSVRKLLFPLIFRPFELVVVFHWSEYFSSISDC